MATKTQEEKNNARQRERAAKIALLNEAMDGLDQLRAMEEACGLSKAERQVLLEEIRPLLEKVEGQIVRVKGLAENLSGRKNSIVHDICEPVNAARRLRGPEYRNYHGSLSDGIGRGPVPPPDWK